MIREEWPDNTALSRHLVASGAGRNSVT